MALFLTTSHFTYFLHKCLKLLALQVGFLKQLGDAATVLLDLDDEIRSLRGALAVFRLLVQTKISLDYYN